MATNPTAQGAQVEHPQFGLASINDCGEKKFVLAIVLPNLKKSDQTPSVEKRRTTKKKAAAPAAAAT